MVSGQSPQRKIAPWLGLGFGSRLGLVLGSGDNQTIAPEKKCNLFRVWLRVSFGVWGRGGEQFSSGTIVRNILIAKDYWKKLAGSTLLTSKVKENKNIPWNRKQENKARYWKVLFLQKSHLKFLSFTISYIFRWVKEVKFKWFFRRNKTLQYLASFSRFLFHGVFWYSLTSDEDIKRIEPASFFQ